MREVHPNIAAYRATGLPMVERHLLWVTPKSGPLGTGFWTGSEDLSLQVVNPATGTLVSRPYHAAGSLMRITAMTQPSGLDIHPWTVDVSPLNDVLESALASVDLRGAAVELHRLWLHFETRAPLAPARLWNDGHVNTARIQRGPVGSEAQFQLTIAPRTRALTIGNPELLSDAIQRQRSGDRFLRHIGQQGTKEIRWGGK